jgi:hypothetical protein
MGVLPEREVVLGEIDRFLLPADDQAILMYLLEYLFTPHSFQERLSGALVRMLRGGAARGALFTCYLTLKVKGSGEVQVSLRRDRKRQTRTACTPVEQWTIAVERVQSVLSRKVEPFGDGKIDNLGLLRSILLQDYPGSARQRLIVFLFTPGRARPVAVLKLRPCAAPGHTLWQEWQTLQLLSNRLPASLRDTIPVPLGFGTHAGIEMLLASSLAGRSAYVEMHGDLFPGRRVASHFHSAAEWLAHFHTAMRQPGEFFSPEPDKRTLREMLLMGMQSNMVGDLSWHDKLCDLCVRSPLPLTAAHGDFWARNLLVDRDGDQGRKAPAGLVDWEHFSEMASPADDLFHFPLTYGLNYPWSRYQRQAPEEAFRLAFIEQNHVSRAIKDYFRCYCARTGLDEEMLQPLFYLYLLAGALRHQNESLQQPEIGENSKKWLQFYRMLTGANRSVFSG